LRNIAQKPAISGLVTRARGKQETLPVCLAIMHEDLLFLFVRPKENVTRGDSYMADDAGDEGLSQSGEACNSDQPARDNPAATALVMARAVCPDQQPAHHGNRNHGHFYR